MKKLIAVVIFFASTSFADSFCDGFESGFKQGACDGKFGCIEPISPICPIPNIGESSFRDGYNRGFKNGLFSR